jgi:HlyD family secretion protein
MSFKVKRLVLLGGLLILVTGVIGGAQDRKDGELVGRDAIDIFNTVEGRTLVITSVPEGTRVEKGDIVCELDPSEIRDRIAAQEIVMRGAEADVHATRIAREVAVMAVNEYKEGTFMQEFAATESGIKLTEAELARAEDNLDWVRRMFEKGYTTMAEKVTAELVLKHARFALELGQTKKKILIDHSKARTIKALTGEVEAARARELAKLAALERERSAQKRLTDQIGRCKVTAPAGGRLKHATPIGAGAVVHDGQVLCKIVTSPTADAKAN